MAKKVISLTEWAKKNKVSRRHADRLVAEGKIPVKPFFRQVSGVEEDFKLKA